MIEQANCLLVARDLQCHAQLLELFRPTLNRIFCYLPRQTTLLACKLGMVPVVRVVHPCVLFVSLVLHLKHVFQPTKRGCLVLTGYHHRESWQPVAVINWTFVPELSGSALSWGYT